MTTATSPAPDKADKAQRPLSIFEWMQKRAKPIFILCFISMFGFGAWAQIHDRLFGAGKRSEDAPPEVVGTYEWNGKKYEITYDDYRSAMPDRGRGDISTSAPGALSELIRRKIVEDADVYVSNGERKDAIQTEIVNKIKQANDGKFSPEQYTNYVNRAFGCTPEQFQTRLQSDMRMQKLMREISRVGDNVATPDIYEQYKKQFVKVKIAGFFASTDQFVEKAKLPVENGQLTAAGNATLQAWWKEMKPEQQARFRKGGATMTAEGLGFRFAGKTDAELDKEFNDQSVLSKTSLAELTKNFTPTAEDLAKLKLRFTRLTGAYDVKADADVEKEFEARKNRLTQEWKILMLEKQIYATISAEIAAGRPVDFRAIAQKNNLVPINVQGMTFEALMKHPEFPGTWVGRFVGLKDGDLLNWDSVIDGPNAIAFARGPVDEFGKHASIWRMTKKDENPAVNLADVLTEAREAYEKEAAVKMRDAVLKAFEDKMDTLLTEKTKAFADTAKADAKKAIEDETKGMDPAKDKEKIDAITKSNNDQADVRITAEKAKYRSEAFDLAWSDKTIADGVRDTQGYFKAQQVRNEALPDKDKATLEEKVAAAIRRDFQMQLLDQPQQDKYIDVGTVSPMTDSTSFPGLRGIAKLVEKKVPTVADMFASPQEMAEAEFGILQKSMMARFQSDWDLPTLKRAFKFESTWLDNEIAKDLEQKKKDEEFKINGPRPKAITPKPPVAPQTQPAK